MSTSAINRFCRYELRTTDVDGAQRFYDELFGPGFRHPVIDVVELPPQAAARGAVPHWLGYVAVEDTVSTMYRLLELGATQLGPPRSPTDGDADAIVRDPFGARLALTSRHAADRGGPVAWHLLSVRDETRAFAAYADIFGWTALDSLDLGEQMGRHVTFTWDRARPAVGSVADIARLPHVHPQWLFCFRTAHLDRSLERVRDLGGLTMPAMTTADGHRVAACDDPQGAAFALYDDERED